MGEARLFSGRLLPHARPTDVRTRQTAHPPTAASSWHPPRDSARGPRCSSKPVFAVQSYRSGGHAATPRLAARSIELIDRRCGADRSVQSVGNPKGLAYATSRVLLSAGRASRTWMRATTGESETRRAAPARKCQWRGVTRYFAFRVPPVAGRAFLEEEASKGNDRR